MMFRAGCLLAVAAGCGDDGPVHHLADAPPALDAARPALDTAPPVDACDPRVLVGGLDVGAQGWTLAQLGPNTLTYDGTGTALATTTTANVGGQLLLVLPDAVPTTGPFWIAVELSVAGSSHNLYDASAAIMGSFSGVAGTTAERGEMIYLDPAAVGWADNTAPAYAATVADGAFHTVVLAVDATGGATVTVDGAAALARTGFTTDGTIAIGDQTNDAGYDATLVIRSVATSARCGTPSPP